jgi:LPS O-antigen subunit length determinant protein (WzzB/FepE family)
MKGPPSGYFIVVPESQGEADNELAVFGSELLATWKLLLIMAVLGGLIAAAVAFLLPPKYRAQALVAPVTQSTAASGGGGGGVLRQLGGIAAMAGIDIGSSSGRKDEFLATLNAKGFARDFIQTQNLLPILYARRWDAQSQRWRADATPPTLGEATKLFTEDVVSISDDHKTGFVTVTVDWYSPQLAAQWANGLIEMVNERLRTEAIHDAERRLDYLNKELAKTNVVEIRQAIYRLTEEQVNNAMLANVQHEYAYRFLDTAIAPEKKYSPKRAVMGSVGTVAGLFVGVLVVYVRRVRAKRHGLSAARA